MPVPESSMRQSGLPERTHSGLARVVHGLGGGVEVGGEVEVLQAPGPWEVRLPDPPQLAALAPVLALGVQQLDEEVLVGRLLARRPRHRVRPGPPPRTRHAWR